MYVSDADVRIVVVLVAFRSDILFSGCAAGSGVSFRSKHMKPSFGGCPKQNSTAITPPQLFAVVLVIICGPQTPPRLNLPTPNKSYSRAFMAWRPRRW